MPDCGSPAAIDRSQSPDVPSAGSLRRPTTGLFAMLGALTLAAAPMKAMPAPPAEAESPPHAATPYAALPADHDTWASDPTSPGPDIPPAGRSLFDHLVAVRKGDTVTFEVPFPFRSLVELVSSRIAPDGSYNGGMRQVMIPMGRSLQRNAAAPDFFKYPRIVHAVVGDPAGDARNAGILLKDRLYIGYVEKTGVLEIVSYNEAAGRFEFQLVKDYRPGGQPKIYYAPRAICIACHQNHAPIFSAATWGETSANGRVAELLRDSRRDFDQSAIANIDFPDDIEKATVRANALVPLQTAWRRGCETPDGSLAARRCRAAALKAVLQFGLSGERDFDSAASDFRSDFAIVFAGAWRRNWPDGMAVAQPTLPDRTPLGTTTSFYGGTTGEEVRNWAAAANVTPALDPIAPRKPRETWRFSGALDAPRFVAGWSRFFAPEDFRALDAYLSRHGRSSTAARVVYTTSCQSAGESTRGGPFRFRCAGGAGTPLAVDVAGSFDSSAPGSAGHLEWVALGAAGRLRDVPLEPDLRDRVAGDDGWHAVPKPQASAARLADGRALERVELRRAGPKSGAGARGPGLAEARVVIVDDFALVRAALTRLIADRPTLLDDRPLARATLMRALFEDSDWTATTRCCDDASGMPAPELDLASASREAIDKSELQPFFTHCAMCHLSHERFPPNFLAGDLARVQKNFDRCAPRMWARLAAWRSPEGRQQKTPMPPPLASGALGMSAARWSESATLGTMTDFVAGRARAASGKQTLEALFEDGYEALPDCLSD